MDWAIWATPLAVFASALILGLIAMLITREPANADITRDGERRDLDQDRAAALQALKDLEMDQDKLAPEDYQRERAALIARGGAAGRELGASPSEQPLPDLGEDLQNLFQMISDLDGDGERSDEEKMLGLAAFLKAQRAWMEDDLILRALTRAGIQAAPAHTGGGMAPAWKGALSASLVFAIGGALLYSANTSSVPRKDGASMTGNQDLGVPEQPGDPPWMGMARNLEKKLAEDPTNLDIANELTQLYMSAGDPGKAMEYNRKAFEINDKDPTARTYKAVLAAMVGMTDRAIAGLEEVLTDQPGHVKALTYLGLILLEAGRGDEAVATLERAVALQPDVVPLQQALKRARQRAGKAPATPPSVPAAAGDVVLAGTLYLDESAQISGSEILFVSVRAPGGGPPLAALRLPPGPFPMDFQVTTANAIAMGGAPRPFPDTMLLSVRIDKDGDPISKATGEPTATVPNAAKGSTDLKLTLQ